MGGAAVKPVCIPCQRFFRPKKSGTWFIEGMPTDNLAAPGTAEPERWKPYKLWAGDLWACGGCGAEIVVGVAHHPLAEHFQSDFAAVCERSPVPLVQINDC